MIFSLAVPCILPTFVWNIFARVIQRQWIEFAALLRKEHAVEWKQQFAIQGLAMYTLVMAVTTGLSFHGQIAPITWNIIFWITQLFLAVNAIAKSFLGEPGEVMLQHYLWSSPEAVFLSKFVYNSFIMSALGIMNYGLFSIFVLQPVQDHLLFILTIILSGPVFASTFTLVAAIASRARRSSTLLAVIGFPVSIPALLGCIRAGKSAMDGLGWAVWWGEAAFLPLTAFIILGVSVILYSFLWRE